MEEDLQRLVEDFLTQKQILLVQVKKGILSKEHHDLSPDKQGDHRIRRRGCVFGIRETGLGAGGSFKRIRAICVRLFQIVTAHG